MESEDWDGVQLSEQMLRYIEATSQQSLAERRAQVRFAAILCHCKPWYNPQDPAPAQHDCAVHTTIMFDKQGDWF